jgi:ubiquinone/menaquinone biosynthesis C-methylase UbiE
MNNQEEVISKFWSEKSKQYKDKEGKNYLFYEYNLRNNLVSDLALKYRKDIKDKLADFGCGDGFALSKINQHFDKCYGIDISQDMVNLASSRLPNVSIMHMSLNEFNKSVNCIISIGVMEYLAAPDDLFLNGYRVLSKDGVLIFTFNKNNTLFSNIESAYRYFKRILFPDKIHSLNIQYNRLNMKLLCEKYKFNIIEEYDFGFRTNAFSFGMLKYIYPIIEILLDKMLRVKKLRRLISTSTVLVLKKY